MKKQFFAHLLAACLLIACNTTTENGITGTYIHHDSDESGMLWDTLKIDQFNNKENLYSVVKKSAVIYIRNGKDTLPVEYKTNNYTATYNETTNNFHIKELGADYILDQKEKMIRNAQKSFEKID